MFCCILNNDGWQNFASANDEAMNKDVFLSKINRKQESFATLFAAAVAATICLMNQFMLSNKNIIHN